MRPVHDRPKGRVVSKGRWDWSPKCEYLPNECDVIQGKAIKNYIRSFFREKEVLFRQYHQSRKPNHVRRNCLAFNNARSQPLVLGRKSWKCVENFAIWIASFQREWLRKSAQSLETGKRRGVLRRHIPCKLWKFSSLEQKAWAAASSRTWRFLHMMIKYGFLYEEVCSWCLQCKLASQWLFAQL